MFKIINYNITNLTTSFLIILFLSIALSNARSQSIEEEKFISIGGIEQWITINGTDKTKPAVLFLHGGPGSVMSPYAEAIYNEWKEDFVLVNWDQRGAGKTFGRNSPTEVNEDYWIENPLTVNQMVEDGIELTRYLIKYLNKQKIILFGTSWGSILGTKMALKHPELFHAYVGHAQFVNFIKNMKFAYQKVYELAKHEDDEASVRQLESLGEPPYNNAMNTGQFLRIVKKYEQENSIPAPDNWWILSPEYDNERDNSDRYNGDDYSFIHFAGHEKLGIKSMARDINFFEDGLEFKIPVYFIQGDQDILTSTKINKPYFDKISAPDKGYFLITDAGHSYNRAVVDKQYQILKERVIIKTGNNNK